MDQLCKHFGFTKLPFTLSPNTQFFVNLKTHKDCFNTLVFALGTGEGFVKVTGEVGTGKTVLCRKLLNQLTGSEYVTAYIPNPAMPPEVLRRALARELNVLNAEQLDHYQLIEAINDQLIRIAQEGKRTILVIDEAQSLPEDTLEEVRLLSNLETEQQKLIQMVLFGQPELNDLLAKDRFRQLKQRLAFSASLDRLDFEDLEQYVTQRVHVAGYNGAKLFEYPALKTLHKGTSGTPRVINVVAQKSLLLAFSQGESIVTREHVKKALVDTEAVPAKRSFWQRLFKAKVA
ncbi:ExeA family protein [Litoribrevibacter euphylliae]|uniref:ExeA family protein n=1 Tax=Litoribrevibacter euphylliae TaxID=1834034 RepID=A0ABV7HI50_9GAMM